MMISTEIVQAAAGLLTAIAAVVAIYVALRAERRSQMRFDEQLQQSRELAHANIRPLMVVSSQVYENLKSIRMINRGLGAAIVTRLQFAQGNKTTANLVDLFDLDEGAKWDTFRRFHNEKVYVAANQEIDLVRLSARNLRSQKFSEEQALLILARWQRQKSGIRVRLEYEDVLGERQGPYETVLK